MSLEDLSVESLGHLIEDVFLPVTRIAAELERDRQLALATLQQLRADEPTTEQNKRILSAQIGRSIVPHYNRLREHYVQHQAEIEAWTSNERDALVAALSAIPRRSNDDILYRDPEVVRHFILGCERQLARMGARFRALTF